jgi:hypothetical protein
MVARDEKRECHGFGAESLVEEKAQSSIVTP